MTRLMMKNILLMATMAIALVACRQTLPLESQKFVTVSDGRLVCEGSDYRFVGTNFWYGAILGSEGQGGDRRRLCLELDSLRAIGLCNLRILVGSDGQAGIGDKVEPTLQQAPGVYNDTILAGLDYLLAEMARRDMKAVLYLNNAWEWSGGYGYYLEQAGLGRCPLPNSEGYEAYVDHVSQFATSEKAHQLFYDYVRFIVGRTNRYTNQPYRDDPTIMAWQICNEPRPFSDDVKDAFVGWLGEASQLIKRLDPNHLASLGSEGIFGCQLDSTLYARISADPNVDYITIHVWPVNWSWANRNMPEADIERSCALSREYVCRHLDVAAQLGKPIVIEEFGYSRNGGSFSPESSVEARDRYFDYMLTLAESEPLIAGVNFWAWGGLVRPQHERWQKGDPYVGDPAQEPQGLNSVFMSDKSTIRLLRSHVAELSKGNHSTE